MKKTIVVIFGFALAGWAQDTTQGQKAAVDALESQARTFMVAGGQILNGNPVKGQPYSAEAVNETTQTLADGNTIVNRSSTMIYRDSEGRERREESIGKIGTLNADGTAAKVVFISDPVAKVSYALHPDDRTAEKMPAPMVVATAKAGIAVQDFRYSIRANGSAEPPAGPIFFQTFVGRGGVGGEAPAKVEKLGTQMIEGIPAEGTRTTTTIPAGQIGNERDINIVSERWYSQELQVVVMSKRSDPRTGETVYKLTNVNRTEPLHSMFEVPADYKIFDGGSMKSRMIVKQEDQ